MKRALYFLCFLPLKWYCLCFWGYCYFSQQSWFQFVSHSARHFYDVLCSSVQFSCSVVSDSLWPHGLQHARPPSPSLTPKACSNSCPSSRWCHPIISSSVVPFSSCLQSFSIFLHLSHFFFQWVSSLHQVAKEMELWLYSAFKLNKQADNIQPWHTLFPIFNQSVVSCLVLTVASWPHTREL